MNKKVFLGGTCNGSQWREILKPKLTIDYYDPVVPHWNEEAYQRELREREECDYCLYVITPKMVGFYSVAEVIDDSNKRPNKTVFCTVDEDGDEIFSKKQVNSLLAIGRMVQMNGGHWLINLDDVALFLNEGIEIKPDSKIIENQ